MHGNYQFANCNSESSGLYLRIVFIPYMTLCMGENRWKSAVKGSWS